MSDYRVTVHLKLDPELAARVDAYVAGCRPKSTRMQALAYLIATRLDDLDRKRGRRSVDELP